MEKIKQFIESDRGKDVLSLIIIILVGFSSFGLGRLSKTASNAGIKVIYPSLEANTISDGSNSQFTQNSPQKSQINANPNGKAFFASNRGKKYYSLGCSAGKSLKQENRIYFSSAEEAERAGYERSASCD